MLADLSGLITALRRSGVDRLQGLLHAVNVAGMTEWRCVTSARESERRKPLNQRTRNGLLPVSKTLC